MSYSGDPGASDKDTVRFLLGDTDPTSEFLTDEEIGWMLEQETNLYRAAALACELIAEQTQSGVQSKSVGDLSISYGDTAAAWKGKAMALRRRATLAARPKMASVSVSERAAENADADRLPPVFSIGMHDAPESTVNASTRALDP